jgi:hypothetical protein
MIYFLVVLYVLVGFCFSYFKWLSDESDVTVIFLIACFVFGVFWPFLFAAKLLNFKLWER